MILTLIRRFNPDVQDLHHAVIRIRGVPGQSSDRTAIFDDIQCLNEWQTGFSTGDRVQNLNAGWPGIWHEDQGVGALPAGGFDKTVRESVER